MFVLFCNATLFAKKKTKLYFTEKCHSDIIKKPTSLSFQQKYMNKISFMSIYFCWKLELVGFSWRHFCILTVKNKIVTFLQIMLHCKRNVRQK